MTKSINRNNLVVQHNALIESAYELTTLEKKIMLCAISTINSKEDDDFSIIEFNVKEISKNLNTNSKNMYVEIKKAIESLENREVKELKKEKINTKWVASSKYFENEGRIEIGFSPHLKPYLLKLGKQVKEVEEGKKEIEEVKPFTSYSLNNGLILKSFHSIRLYELLKQYEKLKTRVFDIYKLKEILQLEDKYPNFNNFNKRVLEKAKEEINENTDIIIDYEAIKEGRNYKYIEFTINSKEKINNKLITRPKEIFKNEVIKIKEKEIDTITNANIQTLKALFEIDISEKDILNILDAANKDMAKVISKYYLIRDKKDIKNFTGLLIDAIKEDYCEMAISKESCIPEVKTKFHNLSEERFKKYSREEFEKIALEKNKKKFK